jgi:hypothetical protein
MTEFKELSYYLFKSKFRLVFAIITFAKIKINIWIIGFLVDLSKFGKIFIVICDVGLCLKQSSTSFLMSDLVFRESIFAFGYDTKVAYLGPKLFNFIWDTI